ncbi:MAG: hypothetical protein ABI565_10900 [Vicinamibacteria bacterium]
MTDILSCEALRDDLIALLYDDGDSAEISRARDHLAQCLPCRAEYSELKGVRKALGGWSLPLAAPLPPARARVRFLPAGLAAAAGLILGIGIAVAGRNTFSPAAQTTPRSANAPASSAASTQFVSYDQFQEALQTQESRHQAEIEELRRSLTSVSETDSGPAGRARVKTVSNLSPETIERLLKASEERQARLFEARLSGLRTESDLQRQYDMAQIAAGLAYIDSRTGADAARTSELMKNLVRVTAKPQDR